MSQEPPPYTRFERAVLRVDAVIVAALNAGFALVDGCVARCRRLCRKR